MCMGGEGKHPHAEIESASRPFEASSLAKRKRDTRDYPTDLDRTQETPKRSTVFDPVRHSTDAAYTRSATSSNSFKALGLERRGSASQVLQPQPIGSSNASVSPEVQPQAVSPCPRQGLEAQSEQEASAHVKTTSDHKKRQFTRRTKTGCLTCRRRKKKCDEAKPFCSNCVRGKFTCKGYSEELNGPEDSFYGESRDDTPDRLTDAFDQRKTKQVLDTGPINSRGTQRIGPRSTSSSGNPQAYQFSGFDSRGPERYSYGHDYHSRDYQPTFSAPLAMDISSRSALDTASPTNRATPHFPAIKHEQKHEQSSLSPDKSMTIPHTGFVHDHMGRLSTASLGSSIDPRDRVDSFRMSILVPHPEPRQSKASTEKQKMLQGQPFLHYTDLELRQERARCAYLLHRFNEALRMGQDIESEAVSQLLRAVVVPQNERLDPDMPKHAGSVGRGILIEAPFSCQYGYNLHVGDDVVIQADCTMLDPCRISIGSRTVIGPHVRFYGLTMPLDAKFRDGTRSLAIGGPIEIEEDCFIGGDVIIMPNIRIYKGSVIGAGTVVTKDVAPGTVVAGNPMRVLRGPVGSERRS